MSITEIFSLPLVDDEVIAELREIMDDQFASLIRLFLNDLPLQINRLQTAAAQSDTEEIFQAAHKFKSSCGSIGAPRLAELARRLEQAARQGGLDAAVELLQHIQTVADETVACLQAHVD
jgi:HPt (histidine-containing phosphotransfer) domain-containing protein